MNHVLVVGGAGYVGAPLVGRLLSLGFKVRVVDAFYFGSESLDQWSNDVELIKGDMRCLPDSVFSGIDALVNVAGLSNDPTADFNPVANFQMNAEATEVLARQCREAQVARYVFASTCSVYQAPAGAPNPELSNETAAVAPWSAYARSKLEGEQRLLALEGPNFCPVVLRKGTIFGLSPRMRFDLVVNTFVKNALTGRPIALHNGGNAWRPIVALDDVLSAYVACLTEDPDHLSGRVVNVSAVNIRIKELCLRVVRALEALEIPVTVENSSERGRHRSYRVANDLARELLSFDPKHEIEQCIIDVVRAYRHYRPAELDGPLFYNIDRMRQVNDLVF